MVFAAAVVVAVAVTVVLLRHPSTPTTTPAAQHNEGHPHPSPTAGPPRDTPGSPRDNAVAAAQRLLATAPTVPDSTHVVHAPAPGLRHPISGSSGNCVDRAHWWIAPGTVHAALSYFRAHLPAGLSWEGGSSSSGPNTATVKGLFFGASGPRWSSPDLASLQLQITAVQLGSSVGIRVDAQSVWLHRRTAAETIPMSVTTVDVVVARPGKDTTVRRTLGATAARRLARIVNRLRVGISGARSCPADFGASDRLTFHASATEIVAIAEVAGCETVGISADGKAQPYLQGTPGVDRAVLAAMHLPPHYGEHF